MKVLSIMPNVEGIEEIINDVKDQLGVKVDLRTNFLQSKQSISSYDVVIVHQLVTPSAPLESQDFDELTDLNPKATIIPLVQTEPGDELYKKLFSLGLYNALRLEHSDADSIVNLIRENRSRNDAKAYYNITSSSFKEIDDSILSDAQIKRTISYFRTAGSNIDEVFENTCNSINKRQILYLIQNLPEDVKEVLQDNELYKSFEKTMQSNDSCDQKTIIIEQSVTKEQIVEKTAIVNKVSTKRKLFTVYGNSELCAEMAYVAAKNCKENILVIDVEPLVPDIHYVYGLKETSNEGITINNLYTESSFLQAYELASSKSLTYDLLSNIAVRYKFDNLHILTGNDHVKRHESFDWRQLESIVAIALDVYGAVFVNVPEDHYDSNVLFMITHPRSSLLIPFNGGAVDLRGKMKTIEVLKQSQNISLKNVKYVPFEYTSNNISEDELKKLTKGMYLGKISHDSGRVKARNDLLGNYVGNMSRKIEDEYRDILEKLGMNTKVKLSEKIGRLFKKGGSK
ncbi:MAG: hypothetical protein JEZ08_16545 [Clostridiales bacterium]|nr:hypothetical protein [Clostridiales bacterium]